MTATRLNPTGSSAFVVTSHTCNAAASIAQNGLASGNVSLSRSGYYPLGVVGFNSGNRYCYFVNCYLSARSNGAGTLHWEMSNRTANAQSPTSTAYVLWAKV